MRQIEYLLPENSLERAADLLRETGAEMAPVLNGNGLGGVVTQASLAEALAKGCSPFDSVETALDSGYKIIGGYETGAEALRRLTETGASALLVLDPTRRPIGLVSASDLFPKKSPLPRPAVVGGMATPFGVYLTTGAIGAGVSRWALAATGVVMYALYAAGALIAEWAYSRADQSHRVTFDALWQVIPVAVLFIGMRLLPISGIHAAEHKVVHAIERGEALVPEVVARMPRVHPRCGTNLWAGATIFLGIFSLPWLDNASRLLIAAIVTFVLWRPVGHLMQWLVTTRPPSKKHIEMGIRSGKELLDKYRLTRGPSPNPLQRLWNSGIFHVMFGFVACELLVQGVWWLIDRNHPLSF